MVTMMLGAFLAASTALAPAHARGSAASGIVRTRGAASGATTASSRVDEPAVRVTLTGRNVYDPGDRVRVRVHVRDDSYLVVLHADAGGHVSVLYPLNPGDDNFVHAGEDFDVRGNGNDGTFVVVDARGKGTIYAAVSKDPYHFDPFTSGEQWNAGVFPDTARGDAAESVMTEIVQQMAPSGGRFDYDLAVYNVVPRQHPQPTYAANEPPPDEYAYATPQYSPQYYPEYVPVYYPYYDPWFWRPAFFGRPFFEDEFFEDEPFFSAGFGIGWGGCWGGCWGGYYGPASYGGTVVYNRPLVYWNRPSAGFPPVGYRPRGDFVAGRYGSLYPGRVGSFTNYRPRTTPGGRQPTIFANAGLATSRGGMASVGLRTRTTTASSTVFRQHMDVAVGQPGTPRLGDRTFGPSTLAQHRRAVPTRNAAPTGAVATSGGSAPATAVRARQPGGSWAATGGGTQAAPTPRVETHQAPTRVEPRSTPPVASPPVASPPVASPHVESPHAQPRSTPHAYRATAQRVETVPQPQYSGRDYATPYGGGTRGTTQYNAQPRRDAAPQYAAPQYSAPQYSAPRNEAPRTAAPGYEAPSYQAPHYDAPRAPSGYSGGGGNAPHVSAPGPRSSGGGGHRGGGGGGGGSHGGGGGHHR